MTIRPARRPLLALTLCTVFLASACATGASVSRVKANPGRYVERSVTITGRVTSAWGLPLLPVKAFNLDDGSGEILVVTNERRVPSRGARVRVRGRVEEFAVFGGRSIGLHLRERDLDYLDN